MRWPERKIPSTEVSASNIDDHASCFRFPEAGRCISGTKKTETQVRGRRHVVFLIFLINYVVLIRVLRSFIIRKSAPNWINEHFYKLLQHTLTRRLSYKKRCSRRVQLPYSRRVMQSRGGWKIEKFSEAWWQSDEIHLGGSVKCSVLGSTALAIRLAPILSYLWSHTSWNPEILGTLAGASITCRNHRPEAALVEFCISIG